MCLAIKVDNQHKTHSVFNKLDRMADSKFCAGCQRGDEDITTVSWCSDCSEQQLSSLLLTLSKNCENHPDQAIALYCCQHDKVICLSCVPVSHQNCQSIISIEKAARGVKEGTAVYDLERRISNLCQVTENIRSQRETTLVNLEKNRNEVKKRVSEIKQNIMAHLDKLESEIHKDIDSKYTTCTESVSRNRNSFQSSSDSLSNWKSDLKSLKQDTSEIHLFQVVKFLDAKTYQKEFEIREIQRATVPIPKFHPPNFKSNITKLGTVLGSITVENVQVQMPVLDIDQQCQFLVWDERKLSLSHSFQTQKIGNEVSISSGRFISDDRLLLSHNTEKQLFVCTLDGLSSSVFDLEYEPKDISLYDKSHAVVAVGGAGIQIINLASFKTGGKIKVAGKCRVITSINDKIWVKNKSRALTIMDVNGKVLKVIQTTFSPRVISANQHDDVYCTDFHSNKVHVVTLDGKEREIYSSPDPKGASGVAVDDRGDLYIAGYASNNIHRISYHGQKQDIVLTADDGIDRPISLSYNNETRELLVVNDNSLSINIYKTQ